MSLLHYSDCPSCHSDRVQPVLTAIDHTVSHASFSIWQCEQCSLRFTQDVPDAAAIGDYYRSENYISHSNTSKGLVNSLYHLVRRETMAEKYRLVASATRIRQGKLLDIGAGTGAYVAYMESKGWECMGLEPDEGARGVANTDHQVQLLDMEQLFTLPPDSFDAITLWHVLEHVHDLHGYIRQLKTLIRRSGRIFIAVPNYLSYDARTYQGNWAAYDVPRHLYHFSPAAMQTLLGEHGLQLQGSQPMWFDSYYISMLSEKYRGNGRGNLLRAAVTGFLSNAKAFINKSRCSSLIYVVSK
ncbi:MAG TPA: class I SAM-dependent methyltransferase [Puia sp.]|jgi:2-polyprenyl-3-methyl-5-hydroxy-6-metoxy-1,4-benzoquinol methylase|nr:class I SAM-dependent methyltransferase [Puia sp.]